MRVRDVGEFGLIDRLRAIVDVPAEGVISGIGDDTAVLQVAPGQHLLATCDVQIDGVHFVADRTPPADVGHKALAVNLSDIAAMGGRPRWALISLGLAPSTSVGYVEEMYRGMKMLADRSGVTLVGGNISRAGGAIFVDVTLLGEVSPDRVLRRGGARPGDLVAVTGTLGDSAAGLALVLEQVHGSDRQIRAELVDRHRRPEPRLAAAQALAASGVVTAMMDISDGLAQDIGHICLVSGTGVTIESDRIPMSKSLIGLAEQTGFDPLWAALHGGEDYELLVTVQPQNFSAAAAAVDMAGGPRLTVVGTIEAKDMILVRPDGQRVTLETIGHDHLSRSVTPRPVGTARSRRRRR